MKFILYIFLIYVAYLFIFRLVIPVYLTTRKIKRGFSQMQDQFQEQMKQQKDFFNGPSAAKTEPAKKAGDYIDFEEVK